MKSLHGFDKAFLRSIVASPLWSRMETPWHNTFKDIFNAKNLEKVYFRYAVRMAEVTFIYLFSQHIELNPSPSAGVMIGVELKEFLKWRENVQRIHVYLLLQIKKLTD